MAEVDLFIVPNLRSSAIEAADRIRRPEYSAVFLDFPRSLQPLITEYVQGIISLHELLNRIKGDVLLPDPVNSWLYLNGPLLEVLPEVGEHAKLYCYREVDHCHLLANAAAKIARLTLRVNLTGRVEVEEWINVLKEPFSPESTEKEAEFISVKAEDRSACITDLSGWHLAECLRKYGHLVSVKCVQKAYYFKPLETLEILLEKGKLTIDEAEKLIREHTYFIRDFVLCSRDLDEAYHLWLEEKRKKA
ncbi:MAG: hypothetical protein NZ952_02205 [Candidatus Bathyarchaeota archaeon]|nr:hypothetical protein [Candidatus Bathyarchaeota archaeon]